MGNPDFRHGFINTPFTMLTLSHMRETFSRAIFPDDDDEC